MPATPWKMPPLVKVYEALGAAPHEQADIGENPRLADHGGAARAIERRPM